MARRKAAHKLDYLVLEVYQVELRDCQSYEEFKQALEQMKKNLRALLKAWRNCQPLNPRTRRAVEDVRVKTTRLLRLCRAVPRSFDHPEEWRQTAQRLFATYEVLRVEAGHLYELVDPRSPFGVLRSAL